MSTASRVVKNTGYLYAKMGITMFISLYTTRLILNSLGAADFGIFNLIGGSIAMLGFLNAAMASTTQRFMSYFDGAGDKEKQRTIFNISSILHVGIALVAGVLLLVAGYFFFNGVLNIPQDRVFAAKVIYGSLVVSTMFTVMTVPYDAVMNARENMKFYAVVGVIESLLKLSVALVVVYTASDKLIVYGILMACIPLIVMTIMRIYCHKHYEECVLAPRKYWNYSLMKEMTSFAGWNFIGSASSMIGNYGLSIVLNHFYGALLNAAQAIANQLNGQLAVFSNSMLKAINPTIVKAEGASDRDSMILLSTSGCKFSYFLMFMISLPMLIEAPTILKLWLVNVPEWTIVFTRLAIVRCLIEQTTQAFSTSISAEGRVAKYNILSALTNILPVVLIYILFDMGFSPVVMYIVNISIFGVMLSCLRLYFMNRNCNMCIKQYLKLGLIPIMLVTIVSSGIAIIPSLLFDETIIRIAMTICCSLLACAISIWLIGLSLKERTFISQVIYKFTTKILNN